MNNKGQLLLNHTKESYGSCTLYLSSSGDLFDIEVSS